MGFIEEEKLNKRNKFDKACTDKLSEALKSTGKRTRSLSHSADTDFKELRARHTQARIKEVLNWFCENAKGKYTPVVKDSKSFRLKFSRLEEAMNRADRKTNSSLREVKVTSEARKIARAAGGMIWPGNEKELELQFIQVSLDNYKAYRKALVTLHERAQKDDLELSFKLEHLLGKASLPSHYITWYVRDVHKLAWEWNKWSGDLSHYVFSIHTNYYQGFLRSWLREYCGHERDVESIKEKIQACLSENSANGSELPKKKKSS